MLHWGAEIGQGVEAYWQASLSKMVMSGGSERFVSKRKAERNRERPNPDPWPPRAGVLAKVHAPTPTHILNLQSLENGEGVIYYKEHSENEKQYFVSFFIIRENRSLLSGKVRYLSK